MAKRFNVSIPDALAERMEPFKNNLSLSALMQDAIEREIIRLTMSDKDKELRENFKKTAIHAWVGRLHGLGRAVHAFAEHLVDQAANDSNPRIFELYQALYLHIKKDEIVEGVRRQEVASTVKEIEPSTREDGQPETGNTSKYSDAIDGVLQFSDWFCHDLIDFVNKKAGDGVLLFSPNAYDEDARLHDRLENELCNMWNVPLQSFYLEVLHSHVSKLMSEQEIDAYLCDLDLEMLVQGELD